MQPMDVDEDVVIGDVQNSGPLEGFCLVNIKPTDKADRNWLVQHADISEARKRFLWLNVYGKRNHNEILASGTGQETELISFKPGFGLRCSMFKYCGNFMGRSIGGRYYLE